MKTKCYPVSSSVALGVALALLGLNAVHAIEDFDFEAPESEIEVEVEVELEIGSQVVETVGSQVSEDVSSTATGQAADNTASNAVSRTVEHAMEDSRSGFGPRNGANMKYDMGSGLGVHPSANSVYHFEVSNEGVVALPSQGEGRTEQEERSEASSLKDMQNNAAKDESEPNVSIHGSSFKLKYVGGM